MAGFDDRAVSLGAPEQLAALGSLLGSRTRLAVLDALVRADGPLHINELARRVGVDASPVRTHLELLLKEGVVREVAPPASGRERRFETSLTDVRLVLEGVHRPTRAAKPTVASKAAAKIQKRLEGLARDMEKLEAKARRLQAELARASGADAKPQR